MAHEITNADTMFSVRQKPWHGLGIILDEYPTDTVDALAKSGLGWRVEQEPVYRLIEEGEQTKAIPVVDSDDTAWMMNKRSDTGAVIGVVTSGYTPVQNIEAFQFLDALLGSDVQFETAGSLQGGKRVWVLAKIPGHVELAGDTSDLFIFCANSHDGTMAVTAAATCVRIVCANTLGMALNRADTGARAARTYRFRHTGNLTAKFNEARRVMGLTVRWGQNMKSLADRLGIIHVGDDRAVKIVRELSICKVDEDMSDRAARNRDEAALAIMRLFRGEGQAGDTRGNSPNSAWCLVNSIAEYADYGRRYTVKTNQMARSFEDQKLKQEGLDRVLDAVLV